MINNLYPIFMLGCSEKSEKKYIDENGNEQYKQETDQDIN